MYDWLVDVSGISTPLKNMKVSFFVTLSMIASLAVTEARLCLLHSQYEQSTPFLGSMAW